MFVGDPMTPQAIDLVMRDLLDRARRAPSVHNTQPWRWEYDAHSTDPVLDLYADRTRQLSVSDPTGRNLAISCGTLLHHLRVLARARGWLAEVGLVPEPALPDLLARVRLRRGTVPADAAATLRTVEERCTDRRRFTAWPIPEPRLEHLAAQAIPWGTTAVAVSDSSQRMRIELLASRARREQEQDPRFVAEQRSWLDRSRVDGVPTAVVATRTGPGGARPTRFANLVDPAAPEASEANARVDGTDGLLALAAPSDGPTDWLEAGQALSAIWLRASETGLSVVPMSQVIEVEETRVALCHDVFEGELQPLLLLRVGWQEIGRDGLPRTPRRPLEAVIRSVDGLGTALARPGPFNRRRTA